MNVQELNDVTSWETAAGSMPAADHGQNSRHRKHAVKIDDIVFYGQETGSDRGTSARLWGPAEGKGRGIPAISSSPAEQAMTDIDEISTISHRWQGKDCKKYMDLEGIRKFVVLESVSRLQFYLSPEKYV